MRQVSDPDTRYPAFNRAVPAGGYCWWYIDAISEDHQRMITIIAFIGSVFSPYYQRARRNGSPNPLNHCAINVALYGNQPHRWCMTERPLSQITASAEQINIGPSSLRYTALEPGRGLLRITLDETSAPIPRKVKGQIDIEVSLQPQQFYLHPNAQHTWWPAAPNSSINVQLDHPGQSWKGQAYVDMNWGSRPVENDIDYWCWSRQHDNHNTTIHYDVLHAGTPLSKPPDSSLAISIDQHNVTAIDPGQWQELPKTRWRMPRHARSLTSKTAVLKTLEDTPFYSRSLVTSGQESTNRPRVHESVSLTRFSTPVVQTMLHFRMPRYPWT